MRRWLAPANAAWMPYLNTVSLLGEKEATSIDKQNTQGHQYELYRLPLALRFADALKHGPCHRVPTILRSQLTSSWSRSLALAETAQIELGFLSGRYRNFCYILIGFTASILVAPGQEYESWVNEGSSTPLQANFTPHFPWKGADRNNSHSILL